MDFPFPISPREAGSGKLISYISFQPGAGASTLACMQARSTQNEVALIDFSPAAKVRAYVGLPEHISAASILQIKNINEAKEIYHAGERRDNVVIYPGVSRLMNIPQVNTQLHLKAVLALKKAFKLSIAVLGPLHGPSWITAMLSDVICVVVSPQRSNMDVFHENIELLNRLGCGERIKIVLNQAGMPQGIKTTDCKEFYNPDFTVGYDQNIIKASNTRNFSALRSDKMFSQLITAEYSYADNFQEKNLIGVLAARDGLITTEVTIESHEEQTNEELMSLEAYKELRTKIQEVVREQYTDEELNPVRARSAVTRSKFNEIVTGNIGKNIPESKIPALTNRLFDDILGYGPLEKYFMDPRVNEIKVNGTQIRVERNGIEIPVDQKFENITQAIDLVKRMISHTGRRIDQAEPRVNARLHDGSRLIAQIAPVAIDGVLITIRRFQADIDIQKLIANKAMNYEVMEFLKVAVENRCNIVLAGGTSSGKTTWLNALASFIPHNQSLITIEDPAEMELQHPDVRRLEARPANIEGKGQITQADLLKDALRMAPDRIIVGECRGEETIDMLQAMNTGHDGSMTTIHSNSAEHGIIRMVNMVEQAGMNIPHDAILDQIGDVVDIIMYVMQDRKSGIRRLDHIAEIIGVEKAEDGRTISVRTQRLWEFDHSIGSWKWVGKNFKRDEKFRAGGWECI